MANLIDKIHDQGDLDVNQWAVLSLLGAREASFNRTYEIIDRIVKAKKSLSSSKEDIIESCNHAINRAVRRIPQEYISIENNIKNMIDAELITIRDETIDRYNIT